MAVASLEAAAVGCVVEALAAGAGEEEGDDASGMIGCPKIRRSALG